jgi:hypothetical protein
MSKETPEFAEGHAAGRGLAWMALCVDPDLELRTRLEIAEFAARAVH